VASRANIGRLAAALVLAAALAAATGCGSSKDAEPAPPATTATTPATTPTSTTSPPTLKAAAGEVTRQLAGIPQAGLKLGKARAPITIIEYAGFDCGACASAHATIVPELIDRYVRTGKANLELRILAAGEHDLALALGVHAARPQSRGWEMAQLGWLRTAEAGGQGAASTETAASYAKALGLDVPRWRADVGRRRWANDLQAALAVFRVAKFGETPVFLVRRLGLESAPFEIVAAPASIDELDAAIDAALDR
jgi:protein-disulfide isomerase